MANRLTRYAEQLRQLLPQGLVWNTEPGSVLARLVNALAEEFARVDQRGDDLVSNALPHQTIEMLPEWEHSAGLPDECHGSTQELEQRREALLEKLREVGDQSRTYYIALADRMGIAITITEFSQPKAGMARAGDPCCSGEWHFVWQVNRDSSLTVNHATADNSRSGDRLATWQTGQLECLFRRLNHAHKLVIFQYSS
ncbi:YmfQ family protein [Sansalvadorimonas verongulae]|uniref:YmfQ family protein n=1 Tax=Sansalvadorimonas verongulae TaxID=2172824 RepID=UPI0012BBE867|nr:putative phage tail protein [Sansalvadorimonas verongulae]MTI13372.1 DUF2313 domain-containing protein [Sansalvadorimonas verongulae]